MTNYAKTNIGNEGRVELHEALGLTGAEVSVNKLPAGAGEDIELTTGDWLRVSPAAHRQLRTAADSGITYVCIQVKQGSLGAFTADDAIMC